METKFVMIVSALCMIFGAAGVMETNETHYVVIMGLSMVGMVTAGLIAEERNNKK